MNVRKEESTYSSNKYIFFLHSNSMTYPLQPYLGGDHEEAEEPVGEQHLDLLVVGRQVALRVVALVGVGAAPLETLTVHYYLKMT